MPRTLSRDESAPISNPFGFTFLAPLALGSILNPVNSSMISTALVPIADSLGRSVSQTSWLISALYLSSAIAQPTMGRLADLLGPRRLFLASMALVAIAGLLGALAPSFEALVFMRVLLGVGTSGAYPAAMCMFRNRGQQTGSPPPRTAMGILSMSSLSVAAIGPFLGGVLTHRFGWHAVFAVNLPLSAAAAALLLWWAPADPPLRGTKLTRGALDGVGFALFAVCLISVMGFLMSLSEPYWAALPLALLSGWGLKRWSWDREEPFVDVKMLVENKALMRTYVRIGALLMLGYCMFFGLAPWLQSAGGYGSSEAGLVTMPMSIIAAISAFFAARMRSLKRPFLLAAAAALVGSLALLTLDHASPGWLIAMAVAPFGLAFGMTSTATQAAVYAQAPAHRIGAASGLQRTASYLGSIASASLLSLCFGEELTDVGFHHLLMAMAAVALLTLIAVSLDRTLDEPTPS